MTITAIADGIALYRVFGENGLLLYIGISNNFGQRWKQHSKKQPWWGEMRRLAVDCWYLSRADAEEAETAAIKTESPKYNIRKIANGEDEPSEPRDNGADCDTIVKGCNRSIHSMWHDGYSRSGTVQEATKRYGQLRNRESQWMLAQKVRAAMRDNWGPRDGCLLCQKGFGYPPDYVPMEIRATWPVEAAAS